MSYSLADLNAEIETVIAEYMAAGAIIHRGWAVQTVLSKHPLPPFNGDDFTILCRQQAVSEAVTRIVRRFKEDNETPERLSHQGTLPGYDRLLTHYPIVRKGDLLLVPIASMTDAEIDTKAAQYDAMAAGVAAHADELRRYKRNRGFMAPTA
jgi:hypothetical protein